MEELPPRSETYYTDPLHGRTVSWRPSRRMTKESSHVSFSGALDALELKNKELELKEKEFVEWMKRNYIEDLKYIGMMPCAKSSKYDKIYPISELYKANIGSGTDTYGGLYEHHLEQKAAKGGYKPRSKKSHKKGFKNIHAKKTRKFHK